MWEQTRRTPTVLAVDDDPVILDTLRVLLSGDIKVLAVDDQEQFWKALNEHAPDVVILDVDMPDITGIELCRVMRNDDRWQQTGIIFLTAHRDATTMHSIFDAGADDMVVKPIIGPELQARVNTRIERTELHRRLAEADGLTGLANRATAERVLERTMGRAASDGTPVSVALVDLDHFKRVNDVHGHRAGDDVLRRFAEVVVLGEPTLAGRWGGEEFIVTFDGVAAADAVERIELVLDSFRNRSFVDPDGVTFTCTFSAGIAQFPIEATTVSDLLHAADSALYEAKARGRAQVLRVGALLGSPDAAPAMVDVVTVLEDGDDATAIADALSRDGWHVVSLGDGHEAVRRLVGPLADLVAHGGRPRRRRRRARCHHRPAPAEAGRRAVRGARRGGHVGSGSRGRLRRRGRRRPQAAGLRPCEPGRGRDARSPRPPPLTRPSVRRGEDDPDAEQAQRTQWAEALEDGRGHRCDDLGVGGRPVGQLGDLGAGPERRRADLHRDVGDRPPCADDLGGDLLRKPVDVAGDGVGVGDVGRERLLLGARLGDPRFGDERAVVAAQAEDAQVGTDRRPEVAGQLAVVGAGELLDGRDPELGEALGGARRRSPTPR